jgi:mRNA interferase MazF
VAVTKGDLVLVQFPFTDLTQTKLRPALILHANLTLDEITLCFVSSQNINNLSPEEFAILTSDEEFRETGLRISSKVRVTRIVTLQSRLILRRLGRLSDQHIKQLNNIMKQVFQIQ